MVSFNCQQLPFQKCYRLSIAVTSAATYQQTEPDCPKCAVGYGNKINPLVSKLLLCQLLCYKKIHYSNQLTK